MNSSKNSANIAKYLLETEAVKFSPHEPFTWASGILSPIYCDNRVLLSFPEIRTAIIRGFVEHIKETYQEVDAIAGVATAGIAHGALIANSLEVPFCYVRPEPKKHGMKNQIEGRLIPGQKVVVVEDLISTGGSSLKAVKALREVGATVLGLAAIFSYGFQKAKRNFEQADCQYHTLANLEELLAAALDMNYLEESEVGKVRDMLAKADD